MEELSVLVAWRLDPPPARTHVRTKAGPPPLARGLMLRLRRVPWTADGMLPAAELYLDGAFVGQRERDNWAAIGD